jgi:putative membrane protein
MYEGHADSSWLGLKPLDDQHVGGVIMLAIGGVIYLGGGLALTARVLRPVRA